MPNSLETGLLEGKENPARPETENGAPTDLHLAQLDAARARMTAAKAKFTEAAQAAQRQDPDAGRLCADAIEELNQARAALRELTEQP